MKKAFVIILTIIFHFSCFSQDYNDEYMKSSIVQIGQTVPLFSFTNNDGKSVKLSDYKGKVILINFFATWCGPCMKEMPYIENHIWSKLKDNSNFIILSFGRDHSQEEINQFIENKKYTLPIYADKGKLIYNLFATQFIPRNYLIDQNGKIVYASTGFSTNEFENLVTKINLLLKK